MASAACLIGLMVFQASSKKEVGNSEEKSAQPTQQQGNAALQEPTQGFGYSDGSDKVGHDEVDGKVPTG